MTKFGSLVLSAAIFALPASSLAQYKAGDVKDGGSVSGTVKFKGTAPEPKKLDVSKDKEVCGKTPKVDPTLVVNNGNLANAVVTITDIKTGKKMDAKKVTLDQKGCEYHRVPGREHCRNFESRWHTSQRPLLQQSEQPVQHGPAEIQEELRCENRQTGGD